MEHLKALIRDVPDFPIPGILFKDITTLLKDGPAFAEVIQALADPFQNERIEIVAGIEARGFVFGAALALTLGAGFVPIRKAGKLPADTVSLAYDLEYGSNELEIHSDAVAPGQRVLLIDDLLATGGTAGASARLIEQLGGEVVACAFVIELTFLSGRQVLEGYQLFSLLSY